MTDDRTGFPQRVERMRMQWNSLYVDQSVYEPRQPQDLVRGLPDYQAVDNPRPLSPAQFVGPLYFEMAAAALVGDYVIFLDSIAGIGPGDPVGVVLDEDSGDIFRTTINSVWNGYVILGAALPNSASDGNLLVDYAPGSGTAGGLPAPQIPLLDSNGFPLIDSNGILMFGSS